MKWVVTYPGKPDSISKCGYAAPSWHTFDRRVWKRGNSELELINTGKHYPGHLIYVVTLKTDGEEVAKLEGTDWQGLVRTMKMRTS